MKERPILFSAPMVRALLNGTKTQTRRILKPAPLPPVARWVMSDHWWIPEAFSEAVKRQFITTWPDALRCPYGQPSDRIYVREAFRLLDAFDADSPKAVGELCLMAGYPKPWAPIQYEADGSRDNWMHVNSPPHDGGPPKAGKLRPGIHMPRWASRITREIVGVRVERLQDISRTDAIAEGIELPPLRADEPIADPCSYFRALWESINGPGSWDVNPWVWVVEFKRID